MSHIKFQGHWSIGSREENFLNGLLSAGTVALLVMLPGPFEQVFVHSAPDGSTLNLVTIGPVASEVI